MGVLVNIPYMFRQYVKDDQEYTVIFHPKTHIIVLESEDRGNKFKHFNTVVDEMLGDGWEIRDTGFYHDQEGEQVHGRESLHTDEDTL